ncbi:putative clathrin assembly protein At1g03050 [Primulina tabacum]|uniref:putative clathrin assembly protein At1g03050 n=1 Tax=Primulina tabacum TaxID=48773 RepID=UPI003F591ADB
MAPSKLRKAIGAVKDKTSIGLIRVGSAKSLSELDVSIVKATRHEECPPDERYIRQVISATSHSRAYVSASVSTIARRLDKTKNWVVALKTLMLIHRLLSEGDAAYEQEIFFATRKGTRFLNMSDFRDSSGWVNAWDHLAFVRAYALYLDEQLEYRMQGRRGKHSSYGYQMEDEEEDGGASSATVVRPTPVCEMKNEQIFSRVHHLMQILDRFLACRPTGGASDNRIVTVAIYPIVKESFQLCYDMTETMGALIERFMQLQVPDMIRVREIFCHVSKQYDELDSFYEWCKIIGIARSSEYPNIEKIPERKLDMMDEYIREKSAMLSNSRVASSTVEPKREREEVLAKESEPEVDTSTIMAALPSVLGESVRELEDKGEKTLEKKVSQEMGDLLNVNEDASRTGGDRFALSLFDANATTLATPETSATPWEAFNGTSGDWETELVQSASHLSNQRTSLPGGFDTMMLDAMYQQGTISQAMDSTGSVATGSGSSVVLGSDGRPSMLALPAPPVSGAISSSANTDPFIASTVIAPPTCVQMSEMEKKQRLLVEEQIMWQKFARDGMQGR